MRILLPLLLLSLFSPLFPCTYPNYYKAEAQWIAEEYFVIECLSKEPILDEPKINRLKDSIIKAWPNLFLNSQTLNIRVDVQERANIAKAPIVVLKSGGHGLNGTIARFEGRLPSLDDFKPIINSPVKTKLIKELAKKSLVILIIEGPDKEQNKSFTRCAERGAKMALDMAKKKCYIVKANLDDPAETYLFKNIFIGERKRRPGILILFGKGKGLNFIDNTGNCQTIMEVAQMLDNQTDAEAMNLEARLLLDAPLPAWKLEQ